ncbi:MAG: peptidoglycan editing factor PgeF [Eubacteriales bacterium]
MNIVRKGINTNVPIYKEKDRVPYLSFPSLEDTGIVNHLFTTRLGGVSKGHQSTMNLSYKQEMSRDNVTENFRRVANVLDATIEQFVLSHQTHTTNLRIVTEEDLGKGILREQDYEDVDGLITNCKGVVLSTFYADCVPLFFVDPVEKVIALSHAGWKGTVGKIAALTVAKMGNEFGCKAENIQVAIGPSICQDCYEVSEDVAMQFITMLQKIIPGESEIIQAIVYDKGNDKYLLDLWKSNFYVLRNMGVLEENIAITDVCTCCNSELLFSHRASQGKRGNLGAFLKLK